MHKLRHILLLSTAVLLLTRGAFGQLFPSAVSTDPPADKAHPASMQAFQINSHGQPLNAIAYLASGDGRHPVVIVLHGFPGNEKNLDLAQAIRRAGWNALFFDYRGSWGTPGSFSFQHSIEDTNAAIAYLRVPANAARLRTDPKRVVLIGHSMGGFMAAYAGSHDQGIMATGLISAANLTDWAAPSIVPNDPKASIQKLADNLKKEDMLPLAGCTPEGLAQEMIDHRKRWNFVEYARFFGNRPLLLITSEDGSAPSAARLGDAVRQQGNTRVVEQHFSTDHSYSDHRIALETAIINWLGTLQ